ncbi:DNA-binding protein [Parabacteroides goldsteinii]|uniref:DNA-binding protein n=1 Tax=Parabacteroides goldsteinii TaxID=328812 RepID=A0A0J6F8D7_9BACT|nr:KilA-N domain-containing protein [Parabacteroides goldsteinii]KMM31022.1 DNA-binding protein [Parabacteroides goldsteinii]
MKKEKCVKAEINADGRQVSILSLGRNNDYISLTDIARYKSDDPNDVIKNWMRGKDVIQFLGLWEKLNNPDFKPVEFDRFKMEAGTNAFTLSPQKWITATNAIGIISKAGRYGGTFAHTDIAFEFASWISAEFKLYIIKDYQRLKNDENSNSSLGWNLNRELVKINYRIHTDAIKENLIPESMANKLQGIVYANEADILNVSLFGKTARQWRDENPGLTGNIRDYATYHQLIVLINLESMNAELIKMGLSQNERVLRLNKMAIEQMSLLLRDISIEPIKGLNK